MQNKQVQIPTRNKAYRASGIDNTKTSPSIEMGEASLPLRPLRGVGATRMCASTQAGMGVSTRAGVIGRMAGGVFMQAFLGATGGEKAESSSSAAGVVGGSGLG